MRIALVVVMLLLNCGVGICAGSKPPSPSDADSAAQPKAQPRNTQSKTDSNKPTPKNYPPIIEISKTPIISRNHR